MKKNKNKENIEAFAYRAMWQFIAYEILIHLSYSLLAYVSMWFNKNQLQLHSFSTYYATPPTSLTQPQTQFTQLRTPYT